jgi:hypothetical protein
MRTTPIALAVLLTTASVLPVIAQTATTGSAGCATLYQTAADAATNRISADDTNIPQPQSVKNLTCLSAFFNGTGLNLITSLLNPTQLLTAIEGQICQALTQAWQKSIGSQQCGITLTGLKIGTFNLGGLGSGLSCPRLSFGGGGPPLGTIGIGTSGSGKLYVTGNGLTPTGYTLPTITGLW